MTQHPKARILMLAILGLAQSAHSQSAEPTSAASGTKPGAENKPVNLKALPKEISVAEIRTLMHSYTKAIGASCGYCHEENAQAKTIDFASDANPMKQTARLMIRMTNDINAKYLAQMGDRRYAEPLTCGNCHQGHTSPPTFETKP